MIVKMLKTERDLDFVMELRQKELEILVACLRNRMDQERKFEQK